MSSDTQIVWVKYEMPEAVKILVPVDCDVNDLIKAIRAELTPDLDTFSVSRIQLRMKKVEGKRADREEPVYKRSTLVSEICSGGVGTEDNPIQIVTIPGTLNALLCCIPYFTYLSSFLTFPTR